MLNNQIFNGISHGSSINRIAESKKYILTPLRSQRGYVHIQHHNIITLSSVRSSFEFHGLHELFVFTHSVLIGVLVKHVNCIMNTREMRLVRYVRFPSEQFLGLNRIT